MVKKYHLEQVIARTEIQCSDPGEIRGIQEGSEGSGGFGTEKFDSFTLTIRATQY